SSRTTVSYVRATAAERANRLASPFREGKAHTRSPAAAGDRLCPRGKPAAQRAFPTLRFYEKCCQRLTSAASGAAVWIVTCWLRASCQRPSRNVQLRALV